MRKIIFFKIILVSIFSFAQDENVDASESFANREKAKYQAYYQSMGSSPIGTAPIVLGAGYFLNSTQLLSLEFTSGDGDASLASKFASALTGLISDRKETRQSKSIGFHIKQFVGNSFYYKIGVDANSLKYRVTWTDGSHQAGEYSFNGSSTTLGFQIGNQWQWENFTFGFDWIGCYVPLWYNTSDLERNSVASANSNIDKVIDDDINETLNKTKLIILKITLGWSF